MSNKSIQQEKAVIYISNCRKYFLGEKKEYFKFFYKISPCQLFYVIYHTMSYYKWKTYKYNSKEKKIFTQLEEYM